MPTSVSKSQKLGVVLATSTSMTNKKTGKDKKLERVPCIRYLVTFKDQTEALLDLGSKVKEMSQAFAHQLSLKV